MQTVLLSRLLRSRDHQGRPHPDRQREREAPRSAQVVAVGPGGVVDGKEVKMTVKVGDKVLTSKYSGTEVKVDGEECTIVRQADILAIVE